MATLTESMTRLHAEIVVQRLGRQAFRRELARQTKARREYVSGMCRAVARDLTGARAAWSAPSRAVVPPVEKPPILAPQPTLSKSFSRNRKKRR